MRTLYFNLLLLCAAVFVKGLTDEQKERIKKFHMECSAESHVNPEMIAKARKGEFTEDPSFMKHLFCFAKKAGLQNDAGEIQVDVLRAKLGAELKDDAATDKLISMCAIQKETPEKTAFDSVKCYYENTPTHISLTS
uniref:Odorant-binding protein 5 n=1 Tax=Dastarcus helophoroides TaxID=1169899 RepID=A0A1I9HZP1_9CUCU|nr:odorant-binding protein 5 [Dastarcus helophoroides]